MTDQSRKITEFAAVLWVEPAIISVFSLPMAASAGWRAFAASSATIMNAGTDVATPTGRPPQRSPWAPASSPLPTVATCDVGPAVPQSVASGDRRHGIAPWCRQAVRPEIVPAFIETLGAGLEVAPACALPPAAVDPFDVGDLAGTPAAPPA